MSPKRAHFVNLVCEALKAFNVSAFAKTSAKDRKFISSNAVETAEVADDASSNFDFGACRSFFDFITARTKVAARVEWVDYVEPVEPQPAGTVRERAIAEWRKRYDPAGAGAGQWRVRVAKSRRHRTITVTREVPWATGATMTFSYEGGVLRAI